MRKGKKKYLFKQTNGKCEYCGKDLLLNKKNSYRQQHNTATIDHIYCKNHPLRQSKISPNERRLFLVCYECNHNKSIIENVFYNYQNQLPVEEKWERSGSYPFVINCIKKGFFLPDFLQKYVLFSKKVKTKTKRIIQRLLNEDIKIDMSNQTKKELSFLLTSKIKSNDSTRICESIRNAIIKAEVQKQQTITGDPEEESSTGWYRVDSGEEKSD